MHIDEAEESLRQLRIIKRKSFLRAFYNEVYAFFGANIPLGLAGGVLELGSGGGFCKDILPGAIASDLIRLPYLDLTCSARAIPFADGSLSSILLLNVFHHLNNCADFLNEAIRCLAPGGAVVMVEPNNCLWASLIYRNLHHEPFCPTQKAWALPADDDSGRLTIANGALPWIVFCRDRAQFERDYSSLKLALYEPCFPFSYLLSGGLSAPSLLPGAAYRSVRYLEQLFGLDRRAGLFTKIVLRKTRATPF